MALHAIIGLAQGAISGGGSGGVAVATGAGAAAGTYTAAALQQYLWQDYLHGGSIRPDTTEGQEIISLASSAVGAGVGALTGAATGNTAGGATQGSSVAASSTTYNQSDPRDETAERPVGPDGEPLTDQEILDEHDYYAAYNALAEIDPTNRALSTFTSPNYVPTAQDVETITQALTAAQEVKGLNTTTSGLQTLVNDAPVGTDNLTAADKAALSQQNAPNTGAVVAQYGPTNPGPLPPEVANTFRSGSYTEIVTQQPTTLYRVYGGSAGQLGQYWTATEPAGPVQSIIDSALAPQWGNNATSTVKIEVPAGTTYFQGAAAPQGGLVGGGNQVVFPPGFQVPSTWVQP